MTRKEEIKWKSFAVSKDSIEIKTSKAVLIKMPKGSDYAGFVFWHPAKLVKQGYQLYAKNVIYADNFEFRIFKKGKGYNSQKVAEKTISAAEMRNAMKMMEITIPDPYELHTPELLEAVKVDVLEELKDE